MFVPHKYTGTIWLVTGHDRKNLKHEKWEGKRTKIALEKALSRARKDGKPWAFIRYESEGFPLQDVSAKDLMQMGILKENHTTESTYVPKKGDFVPNSLEKATNIQIL